MHARMHMNMYTRTHMHACTHLSTQTHTCTHTHVGCEDDPSLSPEKKCASSVKSRRRTEVSQKLWQVVMKMMTIYHADNDDDWLHYCFQCRQEWSTWKPCFAVHRTSCWSGDHPLRGMVNWLAISWDTRRVSALSHWNRSLCVCVGVCFASVFFIFSLCILSCCIQSILAAHVICCAMSTQLCWILVVVIRLCNCIIYFCIVPS